MGNERRVLGGGRLERSVRPAGLAGRAAVRWAGTYLAFGDARRRKREQFVLRTAEDVTRTMGDMKGAVMKVGQVLSMMTGVLPDEMAGQLATLQSNAPPMAFELVEQVFHDEFGLPPRKVFRRFEHEPFAAASIGQVHRAVLDDGRKVAVKVQYPGVADAIEHDLANVGLMLSMAGLVARGLDVSTIVNDLKDGIRAELDYLREAANQQRFAELFDGHGFVRVPKVHPELTTRHVIVQEFIEGRPFRDAFALPQAERNRVAEMIYRFCFGGIYRHGLFNGDPHPGNYLLTPEGGVAFVDYGCVTEFPPDVVAKFGRIIDALLDRDIERWRAATEAIGILLPNAPFTTAELYDHMHWYWAPILEDDVTFTPELAAEMIRRNTQTTGQGGAVNRHCNVPEGMVFLTRINFGLAGLMANLRAHGPWRGIIAEYVRELPPSTDLGRLSAATTRVGSPI
ncbi:MAG: AarF/ABC1/UbiB kinase family protein [Thermoflexaceae bacterium]|nr:AarF/ABC1/UbiB kinase family protein [Thermoflexaceae bacterium]